MSADTVQKDVSGGSQPVPIPKADTAAIDAAEAAARAKHDQAIADAIAEYELIAEEDVEPTSTLASKENLRVFDVNTNEESDGSTGVIVTDTKGDRGPGSTLKRALRSFFTHKKEEVSETVATIKRSAIPVASSHSQSVGDVHKDAIEDTIEPEDTQPEQLSELELNLPHTHTSDTHTQALRIKPKDVLGEIGPTQPRWTHVVSEECEQQPDLEFRTMTEQLAKLYLPKKKRPPLLPAHVKRPRNVVKSFSPSNVMGSRRGHISTIATTKVLHASVPDTATIESNPSSRDEAAWDSSAANHTSESDTPAVATKPQPPTPPQTPNSPLPAQPTTIFETPYTTSLLTTLDDLELTPAEPAPAVRASQPDQAKAEQYSQPPRSTKMTEQTRNLIIVAMLGIVVVGSIMISTLAINTTDLVTNDSTEQAPTSRIASGAQVVISTSTSDVLRTISVAQPTHSGLSVVTLDTPTHITEIIHSWHEYLRSFPVATIGLVDSTPFVILEGADYELALGTMIRLERSWPAEFSFLFQSSGPIFKNDSDETDILRVSTDDTTRYTVTPTGTIIITGSQAALETLRDQVE